MPGALSTAFLVLDITGDVFSFEAQLFAAVEGELSCLALLVILSGACIILMGDVFVTFLLELEL